MKYIILLALFVSFYACNKSHREYYADGSLKSEYFLKNDKIEGLSKEFYESTGELKATASFKAGKLDGEKRTFYKNGILKSIENFTENQLNGDCRYFNNFGNLDSIKNFILINPNFYKSIDNDTYYKLIENVFDDNLAGKKSQLNSVLRMNKKGEVDIKKSHYFEIALKKDSINLNDSLFAMLVFGYRFDGKKSEYLVIQFANEEKDLYNVYETNENIVYFKDKPRKKGENFLCGYIEEYTPYGSDTIRNVLFFKKKYFVK